MANTWYVSKSGSNSNSGASYLLSKLTISAAILVAASGDSIVIGSGLYNEKLTVPIVTLALQADGIVILDGTSIVGNPAIVVNISSGTLLIMPYTTGGQFIIQNHVGTNLISGASYFTANFTNVTLISNSNTNAITFTSLGAPQTMNNCVFSGFTSVILGNTNGNPCTINNCTFYNCTSGIVGTGSTATCTFTNNIFSNLTTAWNVYAGSTVISNNNLYYMVTNWKVGATTYTSQATLQAAGYDLNSLWQNPNFVDPTNNVFYLTSNPNVTNNAYLYYGAYPYGLTRGNVYNPDNKWLITGSFDNSGWYNPDGNITMVSSLFQLTTGTVGVIWSPVYDLGSSQTISQFGIEAFQVWPGSMVDTTKTDVRPNYQTSEIRASAVTFNQNDGVIAWAELKNKIPFTSQGSTNLTGRFVQLRLTLRADDVAA